MWGVLLTLQWDDFLLMCIEMGRRSAILRVWRLKNVGWAVWVPDSEAHWASVLQAPCCDFVPFLSAPCLPWGGCSLLADRPKGGWCWGRGMSVLPLLVLRFKCWLEMTGKFLEGCMWKASLSTEVTGRNRGTIRLLSHSHLLVHL